MDTIKATFKNGGSKAIAVPYHGGTQTIPAGEKAVIEVRKGYLTDEQKAVFKRLGVDVSAGKEAK
ncbi:MAG: hypothetical protein AAFN44_03470 [Pseudomonadota bacterium]